MPDRFPSFFPCHLIPRRNYRYTPLIARRPKRKRRSSLRRDASAGAIADCCLARGLPLDAENAPGKLIKSRGARATASPAIIPSSAINARGAAFSRRRAWTKVRNDSLPRLGAGKRGRSPGRIADEAAEECRGNCEERGRRRSILADKSAAAFSVHLRGTGSRERGVWEK